MRKFIRKLFAFSISIVIPLCSIIQPAMAVCGGPAPLKAGNYSRWLDRLDLSDAKDDRGVWYAEELYRKLVEGVNPDSNKCCLIDPFLAERHVEDGKDYCYILVGCFNGTFTEFEKKYPKVCSMVEAVFSAFRNDYYSVFWLKRQGPKIVFYENTSKNITEVRLLLSDNKCSKDGQPGFDIRQMCYQSPQKIKNAIKEQECFVEEIITPIKDDSPFEQVRYLNSWLINHNGIHTGDMKNPDSSTPYCPYDCLCALKGSIGGASPTSGGFARALAVLCQALNIPCVLTSGYIDGKEKPKHHLWNLVQMPNNQWYGVDVTFNHPDFQISSGSHSGDVNAGYNPDSDECDGYGSETYLLIGSETVCRNGKCFANSRDMSNKFGSTGFTNCPQLSPNRYRPEVRVWTIS